MELPARVGIGATPAHPSGSCFMPVLFTGGTLALRQQAHTAAWEMS